MIPIHLCRRILIYASLEEHNVADVQLLQNVRKGSKILWCIALYVETQRGRIVHDGDCSFARLPNELCHK